MASPVGMENSLKKRKHDEMLRNNLTSFQRFPTTFPIRMEFHRRKKIDPAGVGTLRGQTVTPAVLLGFGDEPKRQRCENHVTLRHSVVKKRKRRHEIKRLLILILKIKGRT